MESVRKHRDIKLVTIDNKRNQLVSEHKATCIWKFIQRQSPHLRFRWRYRRILFRYQARIFHYPHKSLIFITWNLIEYLHTQDFQRATAHLNLWMNILLFCFVYRCKQPTKISYRNRGGGHLFSGFTLPGTLNPLY